MTGELKFVTDVEFRMDETEVANLFASEEGDVARYLVGLAAQVERQAKIYCPVDTGRLRASIASVTVREGGGLVAYVGSDVEYAIYVEFGTRFMAAQSFLRRALEELRTA